MRREQAEGERKLKAAPIFTAHMSVACVWHVCGMCVANTTPPK